MQHIPVHVISSPSMSSWHVLTSAWRNRSRAMKVVPCVMASSILVKAFTLVSRHWARCHSTGQDIDIGLWSYMGNGLQAPPAAVPALYAGFSVLSLLILFGDLTLAVMMVPRSTMFVLPALIAFALIAAGMEFILMLLWQLPHSQVGCSIGFAFYLACASALLDVFSGSCCVFELVKRKRLEASRRRVANMTIQTDSARERNTSAAEEENML